MKLKSNPFLRSFRLSLLAIPAMILFASLSSQTVRADAIWVGDSTSDWNTAANWSSDPANPTGNFTINNTAGPGVFPVISATPTFTPVDIFVGSGGSTARLDQTAGTAATGDGNWYFLGIQGANATYNLADTAGSGGTLTGYGIGSGSFNVGGTPQSGQLLVGLDAGTTTKVNVNTSGTLAAAYIALGSNGSNGTNTFNVDNGTVAVSGEFQVGGNAFNQGNGSTNALNMSGGSVTANIVSFSRGNNNTNTMTCAATLTGGTLTSRQWFTLGFAGSAAAVSTVTNNGGAININTTGVGNLEMGVFDATVNTFSVSSGSLSLQNNAGMLFGAGGNHTGTSTFTQNGGTVSFYSDAGTTVGGTGTVNLGTGTSTGTYAYNLNGGTLAVSKVQKSSAGASGTFNFNGGTLKPTQNSTTFMTGLTNAYVKPGGVIIDSNGFDITVGQALADDIGGGGGLTKSGAGTLTLAGTNSFTGATAVSTGTLTFAVSQSSIGSVSVANGTSLRTQAFDTISTPLTSTSLSLASGSSLTFDFNSFALDGTTPLIATSDLTAGGPVAVTIENAVSLASGAYKLISYTTFGGGGAFTGSPFALGTRSSGMLTNGSGALTLNVTANTPRWSGLDNGNWVVGSTGGASKNWKLVTGGTATDYIQGDVVLFNNLAEGTSNINISVADVSPASTTFDSTTKNYTLGSTGGFGIAGSGPLIKSGSGSLVITNANTYTGATIIDAGATLTLGNGTTGNDGTIAGTSGVANEGALVYNRFGSSTANYQINGSGAVTKNGAGTQILGGANTYTGGTAVNAGTLQLTTTAGAANTGIFDLGGGTFQVNLGAGTNFGYVSLLNLTAASTFGNAAAGSIIDLQGQINFTGTVIGNSNILNIANTGLARLYMNGTLIDVSQINVLSGAMGFDQNSGNDRGTAPVDVASGAALWFAGNNTTPISNNLTFHGGDGINAKGALFYEGGAPVPSPLTGTITLAGGTTSIGTGFAADTITLNGVVSGTGALRITGGTLFLNGANTYTGATILETGTVVVNGTSLADSGALIVTTGVVNVTGTEVVNTLTIGGVAKAMGTYGATGSGAANIDDTHFAGTGVLSVTTGGAASAYSTWATSKGLTGANNGAIQDPDFDGIANTLEFVLGGNPLASETGKLPVLTTNASNFIFTFSRADESEAEIGLTFQYGSTLVGWTDVTVGTATAGSVAVTENAGLPDTVMVTLPKTIEVGGKLFGRLKATK